MNYDFAAFAADFPWFFPLCAALFGAIVGSFLNVVIYRMPLEKSIVTPGSQCGCGRPIAWFDNIPVFSWFILRGKARCCGRPYSFRYAFVELLTAALFWGCAVQFAPAKALLGMLFLACLVCATFIDLDHMIIPDVFTLGLGVAGVRFRWLGQRCTGCSRTFPCWRICARAESRWWVCWSAPGWSCGSRWWRRRF